jgi:hypothetical protein
MAWGMGAIFPVRDSKLLKMIADAVRESESGTAAPPQREMVTAPVGAR